VSERLLRTDAIVIGAGISGLTTAHRLTQAGHDVVVLEAKDRVGGRLENAEPPDFPGAILDLGAEWFGPGQDELIALAEELGLGWFDWHPGGDDLAYADGQRIRYRDTPSGLPLTVEGEAALARVLASLDELSREVPLDAPWEAPDAVARDDLTFQTWLAEQVADPTLIRSLQQFFAFYQDGAWPNRYSLLHMLHYVASCGGTARLATAEQFRFTDGFAALCDRLAEQLGDRVRLGVPVRRVDTTSSDGVLVEAEGVRVVARECVVAMAPFDARYIAFEPTLPLRREYVHRNYQTAGGIKTFAVYEEPFWRADGLSGTVLQTDRPAARAVLDSSPAGGVPGVLMAYMTTPGDGLWAVSADIPDDPAARRDAVLEDLVAYFGPRAAKPVHFIEKNWLAEPYTAAVNTTMQPGFLTRSREALSEPVGRLHWCHSELGARWSSGVWVNGGVERAERVAREVAARLGAPVAGR
jgi:monoamine oxidase